MCPRGSRPSLEARAVQLLPVTSAELRSYSFSPSSRDEGHSLACQGRGCHPHQPLGKSKQRTGFNNPPMVSLASENGLQAKREAQSLGHSPQHTNTCAKKRAGTGRQERAPYSLSSHNQAAWYTDQERFSPPGRGAALHTGPQHVSKEMNTLKMCHKHGLEEAMVVTNCFRIARSHPG